MKRVLIISYYFPPLNDIAALQWGNLVSYMSQYGWEPFVLTSQSKGSIPIKIPEEHIIRIGRHFMMVNPSPPTSWGIPSIFKPFYFFCRKAAISLTTVDRFIFSWGKDILLHQKEIQNINPDIIIATYPPTSLWIAKFLSFRWGKPWVADFRDPCSLWNISPFPFITSLDRMIDRFLVKNAAAITTVGPYLASQMEALYHKPVHVIYNGFDDAVLPLSKKNDAKKYTFLKIMYYAGRIHPHRLDAAKILLDWLATEHAKDFRFVIRSLGPTESNDEILRYAKEKHVRDKITLLPPSSHLVVVRERQKADFLMLFENISMYGDIARGTMPGKLFEYLPLKAPIIAIATQKSDIGKVLEETGRGYVVSNMHQLNKIMRDIEKGISMSSFKDAISNYSFRQQSQNLCAILDQIR